MRFENGRLGALILVLAIIMTILGSYVLSLDVEQVDVTKYEYVTDLSGQFDTTQAPTYIAYNPSENYTGYYTADSYPYFGGVDYEVSGRANNYRLNLAPESEGSGTASSLSTTGTFSGQINYWGTTEASDGSLRSIVWYNDTCYNVPLSNIITGLGLTSTDGMRITLQSGDSYNAVSFPRDYSDGSIDADWVIFSPSGNWKTPSIGTQKILNLYSTDYNDFKNTNEARPFLSASIDMDAAVVTLYYDNACTDPAGIYSLSEVVVSFGGTGTANQNLILGTTLTYHYEALPDPEYMDITQGVSVEESE